MKKIILFTLMAMQSFSLFAQPRSYLLYTDANISRLKKQIQQDPDVTRAWNDLRQKADSLLQKNKNEIIDAQTLGLVYRMTGDEKYAVRTKKILFSEISKKTWEEKELLSRTPAWNAGLRTAYSTFNTALGFDSIYAYLTPTERAHIAEGIRKLGINKIRGDWLNADTSIHTLDTMGHNWWSACVDIAGISSIAVRNEIPEAKAWSKEISDATVEWFNYSGSLLQNKIPTFDRAGGFWESINYANFGFSQYLLFRLTQQNVYPKETLPALSQLEPMGDFFIHTTYYTDPENLSVNFGDGSIDCDGHACLLLLWDLGYTQDRFAWYLNKTKHGENREGMNLNSPIGLALNPDLPGIKAQDKPALPTSKLLPDMGWATLRSSWDNNATMLAVKSGLTWNHSHADAGSYILFHNGKNLLIDSGNAWYGSPLYTQYYCQSEAHNVVMFNGQGQNKKDPYFGSANHGSLHNLIDTPNIKYLLANATGPYAHILDRNYRSFLWVDDVILVIDDLLAREPGSFEWLLHYKGTSKRRGQRLWITDENAEVAVQPLYPETFPDGGLPHDFPEKMRLEERWGYEDHHPETKVPYWSISHFEKTARTQFVTAIILKTNENKNNLPQIERFDGTNFLGVRVTQHDKVTELYFNLLADGRIKHRNSIITMNGWETDAYLTAMTFDASADRSKPENIKQLFIGHGSYLRKDGVPLVHCLSKFFGVIDYPKMNITFQGQAGAHLLIHQPAQPAALTRDRKSIPFTYDAEKGELHLTMK